MDLIGQSRFEEDFMKVSISRNVVGFALLVLVMILTVSYEAMGQGRGRRVSQRDKKCEKFVNCHDARDGRLDGRGPDRDVSVTDRIFRRSRRDRDRDSDRTTRRRRNRDRDDDFDRTARRRRDRDDDFDRTTRRRRNRDRNFELGRDGR
jgi:hypothetical protein